MHSVRGRGPRTGPQSHDFLEFERLALHFRITLHDGSFGHVACKVACEQRSRECQIVDPAQETALLVCALGTWSKCPLSPVSHGQPGGEPGGDQWSAGGARTPHARYSPPGGWKSRW